MMVRWRLWLNGMIFVVFLFFFGVWIALPYLFGKVE